MCKLIVRFHLGKMVEWKLVVALITMIRHSEEKFPGFFLVLPLTSTDAVRYLNCGHWNSTHTFALQVITEHDGVGKSIITPVPRVR